MTSAVGLVPMTAKIRVASTVQTAKGVEYIAAPLLTPIMRRLSTSERTVNPAGYAKPEVAGRRLLHNLRRSLSRTLEIFRSILSEPHTSTRLQIEGQPPCTPGGEGRHRRHY
jgi:hypothetical protein